jgi:hypothetical protein
MPSMSKGTPAILVHKDMNDPRFIGLKKFWNYIDLTTKEKKINIKDNKIVNDESFREFVKPMKERVKKFYEEK